MPQIIYDRDGKIYCSQHGTQNYPLCRTCGVALELTFGKHGAKPVKEVSN